MEGKLLGDPPGWFSGPPRKEAVTASFSRDTDLALPWSCCQGHTEPQKRWAMLSKTRFPERQTFKIYTLQLTHSSAQQFYSRALSFGYTCTCVN